MPPRATTKPEKPMPESEEKSEAFLLGQITGQLRELIHSVNNVSMKQDGLSVRVAALEAANQRREGSSAVLNAILKSPGLGWLVGAAVTAWAILTGKVHG